MNLELVTGPSTHLFTLAVAKAYLRVDNSSDDTLIPDLVYEATAFVEKQINQKIMAQTWRLWLDSFPPSQAGEWWDGMRDGAINQITSAGEIVLPFSPLQSVASITTYNQNNEASVFASSNYFVNTAGLRPKVILNDGNTWPVSLRSQSAIAIEFVVGYSTAAAVPSEYKAVVRKVLAHFYENRGDENAAIPDTVMKSIQHLSNLSLC